MMGSRSNLVFSLLRQACELEASVPSRGTAYNNDGAGGLLLYP